MTTTRPPSALRGHTAAEAEARFIPGRKSPYATKLPPIDLPDDFGTHDAADRRAVSWLAATLVVLFGIAAFLLMGVVA